MFVNITAIYLAQVLALKPKLDVALDPEID